MRRFTFVLIIVCVTFLIASESRAAGYSLQLISRSGTHVAGALLTDISDYQVALTDAGEVLYQASTPTATGLFGNNESYVLVAPPNSFGSPHGRSASGDVAYSAFIDGKWRLYYNSTLIIQTGDMFDAIENVEGTGAAALSPQGALAYIIGSRSRTALVAPGFRLITGGSFFGRQINSFGGFAMNAGGTLVFNASYLIPGGGVVGLFTQAGPLVSYGDVIGGVPIGGSMLGISETPSINDSGVVAFLAHSNFVAHIFTQHELIAAPGQVAEGRVLSTLAGHPIINNHGRVLYHASFAGGGAGYIVSGQVVTAIGDVVNGITITGFGGTKRPAMNNLGKVLFYATFNDGTHGLVLATPQPRCELASVSSAQVRLNYTGILQQSGDLKTWQDILPAPVSGTRAIGWK
jgi:hypothetical protein